MALLAVPQPYQLPASQPKKTEEELAYISEAVKANFLFLHLSEQQRSTTFEAMQKFLVAKDQVRRRRTEPLPDPTRQTPCCAPFVYHCTP